MIHLCFAVENDVGCVVGLEDFSVFEYAGSFEVLFEISGEMVWIHACSTAILLFKFFQMQHPDTSCADGVFLR